MYDLVIRASLVYDGSGSAPGPADVAIKEDRIAAVAAPGSLAGDQVVDAYGLALTPGLIDPHSHSEWALLEGKPPLPKLLQGITTEILGQDGISVAPIPAAAAGDWQGALAGLLGQAPHPATWPTVGAYLAALARASLPVNAAYLVPHGALRMAGPGPEQRPATAGELEAMAGAARQAFREGAVGLSTGLIYPPCTYASEEELVMLAGVVGEFMAPLVVHLRSEGKDLLASVQEMLRVTIGRSPLHISHLKLMGKTYASQLGPALELLERSRDRGHAITADQYPYTAGSTMLAAVLPEWAHAGGAGQLLARLHDPAQRETIARYFTLGPEQWDNRAFTIGWESIVISSVRRDSNRWMEGKHVAEIAAARGLDPVQAVLQLLAEEELAVTMITHYGGEDFLSHIASRSWVMPCTDGIYGGRPHPRLYGAFPRFFRRFVREEPVLGWAAAVRRATSLPAATFRLKGRGLIRPGCFADLVLFDPAKLSDRSTYEEPEQAPAGIYAVWVNGRLAVQEGRATGEWGGRALLRDREGAGNAS
ncbi:MAG TPA: D-aminoacylase [Clostridiales bacterium UBA8153]|nr:D-aminoacylase [Clostridiales bacterium UBA8153]